jgi:hypothetical protein
LFEKQIFPPSTSVVGFPSVVGSVAPYNGFADLTEYIKTNYLEEWLDIFREYFFTITIHFIHNIICLTFSPLHKSQPDIVKSFPATMEKF